MAPVTAALLCRRERADRWRLRNGASPARRLCRWLEPGLLCGVVGGLSAMWAAVTVTWVALAA